MKEIKLRIKLKPIKAPRRQKLRRGFRLRAKNQKSHNRPGLTSWATRALFIQIPDAWVIKLGESRWITKVTIKKNVEEENTFIAEARVSRSVGGKASAEDYLLRPRIPCHRAAHRAIKLNRKVCTRKPRKLYAIYIKSGELAGTASRWKEKSFPRSVPQWSEVVDEWGEAGGGEKRKTNISLF